MSLFAYRSNRKIVGLSIVEPLAPTPASIRKDVVPGIRVTSPESPPNAGTCSAVHLVPVKMACAPNQGRR